MLYHKFSDYLKNRYGCKAYKLPINLPVTCPNRDGRISRNGCLFCGEEGAGFECLSSAMGVKEQLQRNSRYIGENYHVSKFIAYFQNYSNTYLPLDDFKKYLYEAVQPGVAAVYISTRPDCIHDLHLEFLERFKDETGMDIVMEVGLQTVNYKTLTFLNRGHTLAEFIDAILRLKRFGIASCAHYIVDLPMDTIEDAKEGARVLSALGVEQVKCHSLYVLKDTGLAKLYEAGEVSPVSLEEYIERIICFLEYLDPQIVVQRLIGRAPEERTLFCSWGKSWWKVRDLIEEKMVDRGCYQGRLFDYLNGKALF